MIRLRGVKKKYRLGRIGGGTLKADMESRWAALRGKEDPNTIIGEKRKVGDTFMALNGIDLDVYEGEALGIIGRNGAGKSTLLKLLSRVTAPTDGVIEMWGRVTSMLEVGTGFHGEMTGRENIYMNGSILGMTKAEIDAKIEDIIEFSEVRDFIDTPVKRYSSGMTVRLGFAVAAFLEPEILIVDEVLAVGDAEFQKKAIGKMKDVSQGQGRTVLFVSHNMASIRNLCTSGVVLEYGQVKYRDNNINKVVDFYLNGNAGEVGDRAKLSGEELKTYRPHKDASSRQLEITEVERLTPYKVDSTDDQVYRVRVVRHDPSIKKVCLNTLVDDILTDNRVGLTCSDVFDIPEGKNEFEIQVTLHHLNLKHGTYKMNFWLSSSPMINSWNLFDAIYNSLTFEVVSYKDKPITVWPNDWGFNYFDGCNAKIIV